ncbi:hypothetical protein BH24ACT3_BH24ACT3_12750 [soil metagenome]
MVDRPGERFILTGRSLPPWAERWEVTVEAGCSLPYDDDDWRDAIVVMERGRIDLECTAGRHRHFARGAVLCLTGLPLVALHNRGREPVVLVAVSRRRRRLG